MKVLIDCRHIYENNGFSSYLKMILRAIDTDESNDYYLLINEEKFNFSNYLKMNKNIHVLKIKSRPFSLLQNIEITYIMLKHGIKCLHSINYDIPIFIFLIPKYKLLATIHDIIPIKYSHLKKRSIIKQLYFRIMHNLCLLLSQNILTVSNFSKQDIIDFFKIEPSKITVIYNSYNIKNTDKQKIKSNDNAIKELLFVGNNFEHKNIHVIIEALKLLKDKNIIVKFNVVGQQYNYTKYCIELVKKYNLENQVKFWGKLSDDKLSNLFLSTDIYVFPSLVEGFGIPLLEAMNNGLPIISSNKTVMPEIIKDAGILINPTAENFAREIEYLLNNPKEKELLIKKGFKRMLDFSQENFSFAILELYNKIFMENYNGTNIK